MWLNNANCYPLHYFQRTASWWCHIARELKINGLLECFTIENRWKIALFDIAAWWLYFSHYCLKSNFNSFCTFAVWLLLISKLASHTSGMQFYSYIWNFWSNSTFVVIGFSCIQIFPYNTSLLYIKVYAHCMALNWKSEAKVFIHSSYICWYFSIPVLFLHYTFFFLFY